ncbi:MAG: hypothetical protein PGN13_12280 [Patulibacter minatonensis]
MPRLTTPALLCVATIATTLSACGTSGAPTASVDAAPRLSSAQEQPEPARAAGFLGSLADVPSTERRLGYVDLQAAAAFGGPLSGEEIARLVLGAAGARRAAEADGAELVAQVGSATVIDGSAGRTVVGGPSADAEALAASTPEHSALAPETESATHSCLGDPVAEVILGPGTLGPTSAIGVSLVDTPDAPAGRKLRICGAPHYVRDLHEIERRLKAAFPTARVGEEEIGEREIIGASIPVAEIDLARLRDLLRGGPSLMKLARG